MKNKIHPTGTCIPLAVVLLIVCYFTSTKAQTTAAQNPNQVTPPAQAQGVQAPNLQTELNLTPDQIEKWRAMNRELRVQEIPANLRLREARRALTEAMESPNPSEELIKQRAKELADAQSAMTQLNALRQARMLQILTPEQRIKLKEIRQHQQELIKQQNQARRNGNQQLPKNGLGRPEQRNTNTVLPPKQRKLLRPPKR